MVYRLLRASHRLVPIETLNRRYTMSQYAGLFKTVSDITVTLVGEYQGPFVALVLSGVVLVTLMYLDKVYGDNAQSAHAAASPASPKAQAKSPARAAAESNPSDLSRTKTEDLSAAASEEAQLSPRGRKTTSRRKSVGKDGLSGSYWSPAKAGSTAAPAASETRARRGRSQLDN
eukprot:TRINITY_DN3426_c0_g1_i1.p2 TRINITY_DN3426_c0_g1~~TRINITY_DN3426_c0_g1_i1.p2  ORF type:complete len:174 (+),score=54.16 TRINITY_DN3426_c0_g1_i1:2-523(+)